jgi:flavin-dependent dehydrogenase
MTGQKPIAIVGGGPAGALAATLLADGGRSVVLFDEKLAWEKPCGGGITHKAFEQYPFLSAAGAHSRAVEDCQLISPSGRRVRFHMQHPVAIFSRLALNGFLLERARGAGMSGARVEIRHERVTGIAGTAGNWRLATPQGDYEASHLILAAGARNALRSQFLAPLASEDLMVTAGYFIPGHTSLMQIQFLKEITGYIWVFPRADHVSAGIAGRMGELPTSELRRTLERWLEEHWLKDNGLSLNGATFYSHILPSFRAQTLETLEVCGDGWSMIGDSAGLVDPITGEGLFYALRSAELCAQALLNGQPDGYRSLLAEEVLPELRLAARVSRRFYRGQIFGDGVLEKIVALTAQSATFRELMSDLFAGIQGYRDLRARMYRILPAAMAEGLAATVGLARSRNGRELGESEFGGDLLAE